MANNDQTANLTTFNPHTCTVDQAHALGVQVLSELAALEREGFEAHLGCRWPSRQRDAQFVALKATVRAAMLTAEGLSHLVVASQALEAASDPGAPMPRQVAEARIKHLQVGLDLVRELLHDLKGSAAVE